jgi:stage II sporulation protein E
LNTYKGGIVGRIPTATIYLITATVLRLFYGDMKFSTQEIGALVSAVIVFLFLPGSINYRIETSGQSGRQELAAQNLRKIAKTKMKIFSDSFLKLSKTLDTISERQMSLKQKEINNIFEDISEKLCKNCSNCSSCWEKNFQETYQDTCAMFDIAEKNGGLGKEDIPERFYKDCICADEFLYETNHSFEIAKINHIWFNRIAESREVIAKQLKEVSSVIQEIAGDIYTGALSAHAEEDKIGRGLRAIHILSKDIMILERGDKRKEIYLSLACRGHRCVTAKEAASVISDVLGLRFRVSDSSKTVITRDFDNFIFAEDTKFKVLTGVARAMKENVSGDSFSVIKLETGEVMIALSDGMGTGKEAGEESETVMSLLEQMIEAGFKAETAIKLINSSLVLKSEKQTFSTIDMSILNLFTGMCEFIKIGAAAAFIKRDNWVETISSTTLPIGMLGNVDYDTVTKKLYEGDIVIMVTDGVLDSIKEENKEAYMEHFIMDIKSSNPQEISNRILDGTLSQSDYLPKDDMTVISAGVWLK